MRAAPASLSNAQGNVLFNDIIDPDFRIAMYIEVYDFLEQDGLKIFDYIQQFGYNYERLGLVSDFDNIRNIYNYLSATLNVIDAPISNLEKSRLAARLSGIRFWRSDNPSYLKENYERRLLANE